MFLRSVAIDSRMLASCNIMDYSLLVIIYEFPSSVVYLPGSKDKKRKAG